MHFIDAENAGMSQGAQVIVFVLSVPDYQVVKQKSYFLHLYSQVGV